MFDEYHEGVAGCPSKKGGPMVCIYHLLRSCAYGERARHREIE